MKGTVVYLAIDLLTLSVPLTLSFDRRVAFFRKWGALFPSILVSGGLHAVWDSMVTVRGDWGFNPMYVLGIRILGLPLEEILFFVVVPYACVFIYEAVRAYVPAGKLPFPRVLAFAIAAASFATAIVFRSQHYTLLVCLAFGGYFIITGLFSPGLLRDSRFWIAQGLSYLPFLVVNGVLTALPVVVYSRAAIWGIRVLSIPLEDFFYSFVLIGLSVFMYTLILRLDDTSGTP
jgi:lycopene cyclase domain-containing protein